MFRPPQVPDSWTTLQIECVSCKELISLAEGAEESKRGQDDWYHPPTEQPHILLRYLDRISRRETHPPHRPYTIINKSTKDQRAKQERIPITCPRCGADNRNWVHILHPQRRSVSDWLTDFRLVGVGAFVLFPIFATMSIRASGKIDGIGELTLLIIVMALAGFLPLVIMPRMWMGLREYRNARSIARSIAHGQSAISPPIRIALILLAFFVFVLPGFIYVAVPVFESISDLILTPDTPALSEDSQSESTSKPAGEAANSEQSLISKLLKNVNLDFLKIWFKYVLILSLLAMLFGWLAVWQYVNRINRHLPRPIYYSVAAMTRVVAWEAKRALEIRDHLERIQWMDVKRNEFGGINLIGLFRADPDLDPQGKPVRSLLRAQRYEIASDRWGRIVFAEIRDVLVPVSAVSPQYTAVPTPAYRESDDINKTLDQLFRPLAVR